MRLPVDEYCMNTACHFLKLCFSCVLSFCSFLNVRREFLNFSINASSCIHVFSKLYSCPNPPGGAGIPTVPARPPVGGTRPLATTRPCVALIGVCLVRYGSLSRIASLPAPLDPCIRAALLKCVSGTLRSLCHGLDHAHCGLSLPRPMTLCFLIGMCLARYGFPPRS